MRPALFPILAALTLAPTATPPRAQDPPVPAASPESQGLDPEALGHLADVVRGLFEEGAIAGAELHVIQNRRTVLHEVCGWKDVADRVPLERRLKMVSRSRGFGK